MSAHRIDRLRARLRVLELPAALITSTVNVGYLTGFTGSRAVLVVTEDDLRFITDTRYTVQAGRECATVIVGSEPRRLRIVVQGTTYEEQIVAAVRELGLSLLSVEGDVMPVSQFEPLGDALKEVTLKPVADLVGPQRLVKDEGEIALIREACALVDRAFDYLLTLVRPGVRERDVALELEYWLRRQGAEKEAFPSIVASGPNSALPHARASDRQLQSGDLVTFDFGVRWRGYHSDLTRTVVLGRATERQRSVYAAVLASLEAGVVAIRPGVVGRAVDSAARAAIRDAGFEEGMFGYGVGHSLGRAVHDGSIMNSQAEWQLGEGMVFTVEPGIYLEGWGGVRIEDDVLVTATGAEVLTHAPRELIEL